MSTPNPSTVYHIEHRRCPDGVVARCGYLIRWTKKNGQANATLDAAARKNRDACPDCTLITLLDEDLKGSILDSINATALLNEADAILHELDA